jgi:hypothetical protein
MGLSAVGNIGNGTLDQLVFNVLVPMDKVGFTGGRVGFQNTWNHTEVIDPTTGAARAISRVGASVPTLTISQDIASWNLQWSARYYVSYGRTSYDPDQTSSLRGRDYFNLTAEYKPTPTLSLQVGINLWDDLEEERTVFASRNAARPISFVETRYTDPPSLVTIQLRKTF